MSTETVLGVSLIASLILNVVLLRWLSAERQDDATTRSERETNERHARSNEPGPRAHADCTPSQPCVSGRGECPFERTET
jgi:hypothetical protein